MMFRFAEEPQVCQGQRYREFSELLLDCDFRFAISVQGVVVNLSGPVLSLIE